MELRALFGSAASLVGAGVMLAWRFHETRRPVTAPAIVIPPLGMSTGFAMFFAPPMRFPFWWGAAAFLVGAGIFAIPLAQTSRLERDANHIVMRRSPAFIVILLVLVAIRFALRSYIDRFISPLQTGALFFVLAFGMILRWRLGMWLEYRKLIKDQALSPSIILFIAGLAGALATPRQRLTAQAFDSTGMPSLEQLAVVEAGRASRRHPIPRGSARDAVRADSSARR